MTKIIDARHPFYTLNTSNYKKWRLTYEGGDEYIRQYLIKFSKREDDEEFYDRRNIAYCPAFAAEAVDEIRNQIYRRTPDIRRVAGPESYQRAIETNVDMTGTSMNTFIGTHILQELLIQAKVGVLIDQPTDLGTTLLDKGDKHPFLVTYVAENILSWKYVLVDSVKILETLLLREMVDAVDADGLTVGETVQYRYMQRVPGKGVVVKIFNNNGGLVSEAVLGLRKIPFVEFTTPVSMLRNVCDYQIALLNLESSDLAYARKANFPIYYEFYEPREGATHTKPVNPIDGTSKEATKSRDNEIRVGLTKGRRFSKGTEKPGFINPDSSVLEVSMAKGKQLRDDIRLLVNLNLSNINARGSSADSKSIDKEGLEAGLTYISLVLEKGESLIGDFWAEFEGSEDSPKVTYPKTFIVKTDTEARLEAKELTDLRDTVPSLVYKREITKKIARLLVGSDVKQEDLKKIYREVDSAKTLVTKAIDIVADHQEGFVSDITAAIARGYSEDEVEQARKDRAERIKLTLEAQGGPENASQARGASEFGGKTGSDEKQGKEKRGQGKGE